MKILMVLTSHDQLGNTGRKTGFWLEEFAAPYFTFLDAGATITLASPKGGQPPIDPVSDTPEGQTDLTRRLQGRSRSPGRAREDLAPRPTSQPGTTTRSCAQPSNTSRHYVPISSYLVSWIARIFSLKNSLSRNPYACRFIVLILLFVPSIGPDVIITS